MLFKNKKKVDFSEETPASDSEESSSSESSSSKSELEQIEF